MKRAYLMEMNVLRGYATSLLATGFLVTVLVGVGMKTAIVAPAVLTSMCFMMGAIGSSVYDDQNGWGSYRLTLPVSKRDVVLSRYAAIATLGLIGSAVGFAASLAVMGLASAVELPGGLSELLAFSGERVAGMAFATAACVLIGSAVASVVTPVYFKFGQTKATQLLPTVTVGLFVVTPMLLGNSGILEGGAFGLVTDFLTFVETPAGLAASMAALLAASLLMLAASAVVSLGLYGRREL